VLRPEGQAGKLMRALAAEGAEPVVAPAIRILPPRSWEPVDRALSGADAFDWLVFTSVNGAAVLDRIGDRTPASLPARIAVVGPATAGAVEERGFPVTFVPSAYTARALARELPGPPARVCLIQAEIAGPELEEELRARGFEVTRLDAYRTRAAGPGEIPAALERGIDAVALTSASIARALAAALDSPADLRGAALYCIGPATETACREANLPVEAVAPEHTVAGLVATMAERLGEWRSPDTELNHHKEGAP
jgi:uroporphyrinogen-III synthase